MIKRIGPWILFAGLTIVFGQKIYLLLSTPWANDDDHMWGAMNLAILACFPVAALYFWFRDGPVALQDRLSKGGEAFVKSMSKWPFGGTR
jgi:hypothetical protein